MLTIFHFRRLPWQSRLCGLLRPLGLCNRGIYRRLVLLINCKALTACKSLISRHDTATMAPPTLLFLPRQSHSASGLVTDLRHRGRTHLSCARPFPSSASIEHLERVLLQLPFHTQEETRSRHRFRPSNIQTQNSWSSSLATPHQ